MMTRWRIPAKTFLVGEYIALWGGPAVLLTTTPYFEVIKHPSDEFSFHPSSPAGRLCAQHECIKSFQWYDPYQGLGGLGASSAQFLGVYADLYRPMRSRIDIEHVYNVYESVAWDGEGQRPSGYDVLAQSQGGCVLIDRSSSFFRSCVWPFSALSFILIHTHTKLATHSYLKTAVIDIACRRFLWDIGLSVQQACLDRDVDAFITHVRDYGEQLKRLGLVLPSTLDKMCQLSKEKPLAMKGCGALGADVILMLVSVDDRETVLEHLRLDGHHVLGTEQTLASVISC